MSLSPSWEKLTGLEGGHRHPPNRTQRRPEKTPRLPTLPNVEKLPKIGSQPKAPKPDIDLITGRPSHK